MRRLRASNVQIMQLSMFVVQCKQKYELCVRETKAMGLVLGSSKRKLEEILLNSHIQHCKL